MDSLHYTFLGIACALASLTALLITEIQMLRRHRRTAAETVVRLVDRGLGLTTMPAVRVTNDVAAAYEEMSRNSGYVVAAIMRRALVDYADSYTNQVTQ
jgi:hypothetical protein